MEISSSNTAVGGENTVFTAAASVTIFKKGNEKEEDKSGPNCKSYPVVSVHWKERRSFSGVPCVFI